jgi:hypothetical protein
MLNDFSFAAQRKVSANRLFFCSRGVEEMREGGAFCLLWMGVHVGVALDPLLEKTDEGDA